MQSRNIHILLADDDKDDCVLFERALMELSISANLKIVNNGEELMQLLTTENVEIPDVLFLDINMPRKSGTECLEEMKQNEGLKNIPVVMISTAKDQQNITRHFKIGANVYIHKPKDFSQLKQIIKHALPISTQESDRKGKVNYLLNA